MKKFLVKLIKNKLFIPIILLVVIVFSVLYFIKMKGGESQSLTYVVKRQNLVISVIENGNVTALKSLKIINRVPGTRNVLGVIDEGTQITEEDIKNKKFFLKLDSKDLEDRAEQLEIDVENSLASYTQARQELEIVKKQNESDITQAELKVKFAKMDLEKYLGNKISEAVLKEKIIDYKKIINSPDLGGEAWNKKKDLENKIDIAKEDLGRAQNNLEWSKKLAEKGYITKNDLEADQLSCKQKQANLEMAELEYELFINYDFPKNIEKLLSDYKESINELERTKDRCKAKLIQSESNMRSKQATYLMKKSQLEDVEEQIKMCTIVATQPGFVTYATSTNPWRSQDPIQPGTNVRMFQELLVIPDFNYLGVNVQVHETNIDKIKEEQKAIIKIDAFPDKIFEGTVKKISLMPDAVMKALNPDLNVYNTQVAFNQSYPLLKPGMSAQVEIIVNEKKNVIAIPIISVYSKGNSQFCYVLKGNKIEERKITLGESNDKMVEVKSGLKEGEIIVMMPETIGPEVKKEQMYEKGKIVPETEKSKQEEVEKKQEVENKQEIENKQGTENKQGNRKSTKDTERKNKTMNENNNVIELFDIKKVYKMGSVELEVLRGITLSVKRGDHISIMGPSGSGKTTLLNILGCLDKPSSGKYFFQNKEISTLDDNSLSEIRSKYIGFIFQTFNLIPQLNVIENISLPLFYQGVEEEKMIDKAVELAKMVGLSNRLYHRPSELSGGQQQRVAIARALANDPLIILADEPTGNLDTTTGRETMKLLCRLNEDGKTLLVITHDINIANYGKKIIKILDGKIVNEN